MIYFKKTLEYLFKLEKGKRFLFLFLIALPAGFGAAITAPHHVYKQWIETFEVGNLDFLSALMFGGTANPLRVVIAGAITIVLLLFSISVMASVISRNLRVGVFSVNRRLLHEFNEAFLPTSCAVITATLVVIVGKLLLGAMLVLFQTFPSVLIAEIMSLIALILNIALVCYFVALGILYLPYMTFNGLRPRVALAEAVNRTGGRLTLRMFMVVFLPMLLNYIIGGLLSLADNLIVSLVVETVMYAISLVYLVALSFVSYYEVNELPREDYTREYFFKQYK